MWASPSTPVILFHVGATVQSAKALAKVESKSDATVISMFKPHWDQTCSFIFRELELSVEQFYLNN